MNNEKLQKILNSLYCGEYEYAIDLYNLNTITEHVLYIINKIKLSQSEIESLEILIKIFQEIYNNSEYDSPISDTLYDQLYSKYKKYYPDDIVGASVNTTKSKIYHTYPALRGSLDKVYDIYPSDMIKRDSYTNWVKMIQSKYNKITNDMLPSDTAIQITPKFDGVSMIFELTNGIITSAITRGDVSKNIGQNKINIFKDTIIPIPNTKSNRIGMKTEIIITSTNFQKMQKRYGPLSTNRNAVSSIINSKDQKYINKCMKYCTIIPLQIESDNTITYYDYAEYGGFYSTLTNYHDIENGIINIRKKCELYGIPIDGVVVRIVDTPICKKLGRRDTSGINNFEVAIKFIPNVMYTTLIDIQFSVGPLGSITPIAHIDPLYIGDVEISKINIGSMDKLNELQLSIGDTVAVIYNTIPYLFIDDNCNITHKNIIYAIQKCPSCGEKLNDKYACVNVQCDEVIIGKIVNYINKMGISDIGYETIRKLYQFGYVKNITDLYKLSDHTLELNSLDGFGSKRVSIILNSIKSSVNTDIVTLLSAIGISGIGVQTIQKICNRLTIDEIISLSETFDTNVLTSIPGIQSTNASKFISGIIDNKSILLELLSILNINNIYNGENFTIYVTFTGIRDFKFEQFLLHNGIGVDKNITKRTSLLIIPDTGCDSNKINKAITQGITIMTISEAKKFYNYIN